MPLSQKHATLSQAIIDKAAEQGVVVATAESCTGGMVSAALTDIPGSSAVVDRCFVTYSNGAKTELLGVPADVIEHHGAVSRETARTMAKGALDHSPADIAVSITGIAGPGGGSADKPVGLVWFGVAKRAGPVRVERRVFAKSDRDTVRKAAAATALMLLLNALRD